MTIHTLCVYGSEDSGESAHMCNLIFYLLVASVTVITFICAGRIHINSEIAPQVKTQNP